MKTEDYITNNIRLAFLTIGSRKSARKICREPQAPFMKVIVYTMTFIVYTMTFMNSPQLLRALFGLLCSHD